MTNKFTQTDDNSQKAAALNDGGFFSSARAASCRSLYVHVPFCERKCNYCAFESAPPRDGDFELYLASLRRELSCAARNSGGLRSTPAT